MCRLKYNEFVSETSCYYARNHHMWLFFDHNRLFWCQLSAELLEEFHGVYSSQIGAW